MRSFPDNRREVKGKENMSKKPDMKALLEAGAHFGHKTSRWHPKMAPYIHSKRQEAHIINLEKTVEALEKTLPELSKIVANGGKILFVGTKKQMKNTVKTAAEAVSMPYVTVRWVGGTLTNATTFGRQIQKLKDLERRMKSGELEARYCKWEVQRFQEEIDAMNELYGGVKDMDKQPAAIVIVDVIVDKNAIKEANKLKIPTFALCDTNVDPTSVKYCIPANDDSIKTTSLILDYIVEAIKAGQAKITK